jgi:hypothetical protein
MSAKICWCCQINLSWEGYDGTYLGDEGEKPCYECVEELEQDQDNE